MADGKRTPHIVRKERPARPTTPISAPQLAELVEGLRTPEPEVAPDGAFELPDAEFEDAEVVEMTVDDGEPAPRSARFAHVVRRGGKP